MMMLKIETWRLAMRTITVALLLALVSIFATVSTASADAGIRVKAPPVRWIEADLSTLHLEAFENGKPVFEAPFTGGMPGWETPVGVFKILRRVAEETMDSTTIGIPKGTPGYYYAPNVKYTQYLTDDGIAIHGNYWAEPWVFGQINTSHGCISLKEDDAAFLWEFGYVGMTVVIHQGDPNEVPILSSD
jgi:lipoprotein-anchoring transpeptidase ErfK/SrfK